MLSFVTIRPWDICKLSFIKCSVCALFAQQWTKSECLTYIHYYDQNSQLCDSCAEIPLLWADVRLSSHIVTRFTETGWYLPTIILLSNICQKYLVSSLSFYKIHLTQTYIKMFKCCNYFFIHRISVTVGVHFRLQDVLTFSLSQKKSHLLIVKKQSGILKL